jgi:hypothetical protein
LVKHNFRQSSNVDGGYSTTDVYNSNLQKLFSIDSTSLPGNAAIFIEPSDGKVINIEGDYYPNQPTEYGMVKEIIDINNAKQTNRKSGISIIRTEFHSEILISFLKQASKMVMHICSA